MRFLLTSLLALCLTTLGFSQTARLQVIHNSPTPTVDIYVNGDLFLDNFVFRTATPYVDVPAGVELNLGIALGNSTSVDDVIANFPVTLEDGQTYVVVAAGVVGGDQPFNLFVFDMGQETADNDDNVGLLFFHGSPDAPEVDVVAGGTPIFDDVEFGEFSGYLNVPATSYELAVTPGNDNSTVVAAYAADFNFWRGNTAVVFATGFLGGDAPAFEPWVALSNGGTFPLSAITIDEPETGAELQVIHNSPDPAAATVDIYVNDDLLLDDFAFQTATPFVEVPTNVELTIGVAPSTSTSAADAIATFPVTFEDGKKYIAVANGLITAEPAFNLDVFDMGQTEAGEAGNFDLAVNHGSPDAPAVDIAARGIGNVIENLSYTEFAGYLPLPADSYILDVKVAGTSTIAATFQADVSTLGGQAGIAIASGLLAGDPDFCVFVALADGTVVFLPKVSLARLQVIHNSPTPTVDVYANSDLLLDNFVFRTATPFIDVPADVEINLGIALANSTDASDAIANFPVTLENGSTYVVVANGIVGGNPGFNLEIFDMAIENSDDPNNVGVLFFHGSPDAPAVDIQANGGVLFGDVEFSEFAGYANVPATSYTIGVAAAGSPDPLVEYSADLSFWRSRTLVIFASGFLSGHSPAFEPWVALSNGGTFPLPVMMSLADNPNAAFLVEAAPSIQEESLTVYPNPSNGIFNLAFDVETEAQVIVRLWNTAGQIVFQNNYGRLAEGYQNIAIETANINSGIYKVQIETASGVIAKTISIVK